MKRTISINGAPCGTGGISGVSTTPSWISPSSYIDPETGKEYKADTLGGLLEAIQADDNKIFDLQRIKEKITGKESRADPERQFDKIIVQLDGYNDKETIQKAYDVILDELRNPDFEYTKSQGNNRYTEVKVKGTRAVIAHDIHWDDERGPHFMAFVHTQAVDFSKRTVSPRSSFTNELTRDAALKSINRRLESEGLAPLVWRMSDERAIKAYERQLKKEVAAVDSEEKFRTASDVFRESLESGVLDPEKVQEALKLTDDAHVSVTREAFRTKATEQRNKYAELIAEAQNVLTSVKFMDEAIKIIDNEKVRLARIAELEKNYQELQEKSQQELNELFGKLEVTQTHASSLDEQLTEKKVELEEAVSELENTKSELDEVSEQLTETKATVQNLNQNLAQVEEALGQREDELEELGKQRDTLATELGRVSKDLSEVKQERDQFMREYEAQSVTFSNYREETEKFKEQAAEQLKDAAQEIQGLKSELGFASQQFDELKAKAQQEAHEHSLAMEAMKERLKAMEAMVAGQAKDLEREREARIAAESKVGTVMAEKAKAEAERDARITPEAHQELMVKFARVEAQRDTLLQKFKDIKNAPLKDAENSQKPDKPEQP